MKQCSQCYQTFEKPERGAAQQGTFICSMACANRWSAAKKLKEKLNEWNLNPVKCLFCSKPLDYMVWRKDKGKRYCNSSCSAKSTNKAGKNYKNAIPIKDCVICGTAFKPKALHYKFCSKLCRFKKSYLNLLTGKKTRLSKPRCRSNQEFIEKTNL